MSELYKRVYSESLFMDSGAYSLYGVHVGERNTKVGTHGRKLDRQKKRRWGGGDYSWFNLKHGSEFRAYCDRYAGFMKAMVDTDILFTTVDAIMNPQVSWETQQYFENEHGLKPIPVIHGGTPLRYLQRYLEAGRYDFLGLGGLGHLMRISTYRPWADEVFREICPKSNKFLPLVKVHGFAMTSWQLMTRWPWYSVDSATWIKLAAYGWIILPPWLKDRGFVHNVQPIQLNMSRKPTPRMAKFWWRQGIKGPRQTAGRHYDNAAPYFRECADRWLKHLGVPFGAFDDESEANKIVHAKDSSTGLLEFGERGEGVVEKGAVSCFRLRAQVNLHYFMDFMESRPKWPHPLDPHIIEQLDDKKDMDFGL